MAPCNRQASAMRLRRRLFSVGFLKAEVYPRTVVVTNMKAPASWELIQGHIHPPQWKGFGLRRLGWNAARKAWRRSHHNTIVVGRKRGVCGWKETVVGKITRSGIQTWLQGSTILHKTGGFIYNMGWVISQIMMGKNCIDIGGPSGLKFSVYYWMERVITGFMRRG